MKCGPVTKIVKRNMVTSKKNLTLMSCSQIVASLLFFQYMSNLKQSGSRILHSWSVIPTFWLTVTFYLVKTENRTKKSLRQLS